MAQSREKGAAAQKIRGIWWWIGSLCILTNAKGARTLRSKKIKSFSEANAKGMKKTPPRGEGAELCGAPNGSNHGDFTVRAVNDALVFAPPAVALLYGVPLLNGAAEGNLGYRAFKGIPSNGGYRGGEGDGGQ